MSRGPYITMIRQVTSYRSVTSTLRFRPLISSSAHSIIRRAPPAIAPSYHSSSKWCNQDDVVEETVKDLDTYDFDYLQEETSLTILKKSRRSFERQDSISANILSERKNHAKKLVKVQAALDPHMLIHRINGKNKSIAGGLPTYQVLQHIEDATHFSEPQRQLLSNIPGEYVRFLERLGFCRKKYKKQLQNTYLFRSKGFTVSSTGAEGIGTHVGTAQRNWPIFKHLLPEISFAGHSNCGKSSLVNALTGLGARKGPARVSDRAGWTNQISFFQLGRMPPKLTLVDFPGYGFAVATIEQKRHWKMMISDYLKSRDILSCCCVLVDCTRGLCTEDKALLQKLRKLKIDWRVVLTKCDILSPNMILNSILVVIQELDEMNLFDKENIAESKKNKNSTCTEIVEDNKEKDGMLGDETIYEEMFAKVIPVSSSTGAGIQYLWEELNKCARKNSKPVASQDGQENPMAVREHKRAKFMRKKEFLETKLNVIRRMKVKGKIGA